MVEKGRVGGCSEIVDKTLFHFYFLLAHRFPNNSYRCLKENVENIYNFFLQKIINNSSESGEFIPKLHLMIFHPFSLQLIINCQQFGKSFQSELAFHGIILNEIIKMFIQEYSEHPIICHYLRVSLIKTVITFAIL